MNANGVQVVRAIPHLGIKARVLCFLANGPWGIRWGMPNGGHACGAVSYNRGIKNVGDGAGELPSDAGYPARGEGSDRSCS